ncbi:hypothetical protein B0O99DRAFT_689006 [Bisporella sp. PMI_857]|nr:hypothetical protein B0O99DRAFT_689006 [Bisporella sp. PMI_857]
MASSRDAMSRARSLGSPALEDLRQPRKNEARKGKRAVTHLSEVQLARKRANDREAQRNIRARTKEYIETLEKKVKEFEASSRSSSVERIIKRNEQLEVEVEELRAQLARTQTGTSREQLSNMPEELVIPHRAGLEWLPETELGTTLRIHRAHQDPSIDNSGPPAQMDNDAQHFLENQLYPPCVSKYEDSKTPQDPYALSAIPAWNDQIASGENSQGLLRPTLSWIPFHPALSQPLGYADLNSANFSEVISTPAYPNTTC